MAQVRPVTSEALEAQIRDLLPSQNGFTEDLQAQNVIVPIIDLTSAAAGSNVPAYQAQAWDLSSGHSTVNNATSTLISNTGFWKVLINYREENVVNNTVQALGTVFIDTGLTTQTIWRVTSTNTASQTETVGFDVAELFVFLKSGESLKATSASTRISMDITYRQVADINGTVTLPTGFTPQ